ncbi:hypothetical protein EXIGLDRAFT_844237 [Exidia glandulosa HHB12029]|uniref:Uncharacterized protein n=1 Tax=Exidia glandulosa HHB12029 TaxID=1314781 RepID=A0A165C5G0_EXIGL|nr:hypothetical protein EXIGLDRAFT_844237 [Exidia glandulosa HHB12029]
MTPRRVDALRTTSPPPLVLSPGPSVAVTSWGPKCKWSSCTIELPFATGDDLLAHVLEAHVRPRSPNTPRDVVSVTDVHGRTRTYGKVTCKWSECEEVVVIRAKYVAHFEGHIFADFERFGSTSPVRLTSVPLIPPPPTPKRPRGRPQKAELKPDADADEDVRPLKKRLRGNDALDEGTIVVRWGGSGDLPASVPPPGSEVQPSSSQLEPEYRSSQLSPAEIERGDGSPRGSTTDSEEEDEELDWSLS